MKTSVQTHIEQLLEQTEPGELVFPGDFLEFGSPEAVHTALSRLTADKKLMRMAKGIYLKPKTDPVVGVVRPSLEKIAHTIAEKEQVIIRPTGLYALNKLGLSTQVPTKVVFLTNGSARTIRIGRATLRFKPTTPKKLAAKDETLFLVIQALLELGPDQITPKILTQLKEILKTVPLSVIRESAKLAPQFIARLLYNLAGELAQYD